MSNQYLHKLSRISEEPSTLALQPDSNPSTMDLKSSMEVEPEELNGEAKDGNESDSTITCGLEKEVLEESDLLDESGNGEAIEESGKNETPDPISNVSKSEPIMPYVDVHLEPNIVVSNSAGQLDETDDEQQHACFFNRTIHDDSLLNGGNNVKVKESPENAANFEAEFGVNGKNEVKEDKPVEVKEENPVEIKKENPVEVKENKPIEVKVHACFFNRPIRDDENFSNDVNKIEVKPDEDNAANFEAEFGVGGENSKEQVKKDIEAINEAEPVDNNAANFEAEFGVNGENEAKIDGKKTPKNEQTDQDNDLESNKSENEDKNLKHKIRHAIDSPRRWYHQIRNKHKAIKKDKYDHPHPIQRLLHAIGISGKSESDKEEREAGPSNSSSFHQRLKRPHQMIKLTSSATTLKKKPFSVLGKIPEEAPNQKHDDVLAEEEETKIDENNHGEVKESTKKVKEEVKKSLSMEQKEEIVEAVETLQDLCELDRQLDRLKDNEYKC